MTNENDRYDKWCGHKYPCLCPETEPAVTPAPQDSQPVCEGHTHGNCAYLAICDTVCNKCGQLVIEDDCPTQATEPVCEHNHTMRHAYSHIPQGYDECSLCGATRVEGEDWRSATAQPVNPAHDKCVCGHIRAFDCHRDLEDMNFAPAQISCERGLHDFAAATEGERCKHCPLDESEHVLTDKSMLDNHGVARHKFQPTETEVTG